MITTLHRPAWADVDVEAAALFDADAQLVDELIGAVPTWRLGGEPIYLEVVRDLGVPGLDEPAAPAGEVVAGEVLPATEALDLAHLFDDEPVDQHDAPTAPIALVPTTSIPVTGRGGRKRRAPRSTRRTA